MISLAANKLLVTQIANAFCVNSSLCKGEIRSRLNVLTDSVFANLLMPYISDSRWYKMTLTKVIDTTGLGQCGRNIPCVNMEFNYIDLINGKSGSITSLARQANMVSDHQYLFEGLNHLNFRFFWVADCGDKCFIVRQTGDTPYGLYLIPISAGGGSTTGGGGTTGGSTVTLTTTPPIKQAPQGSQSSNGGFDLSSLEPYLIPGAIAIAFALSLGLIGGKK
jgi:hypothetical protein